MTPVYIGRVQTRLFALALVGGLWTLVIAPQLPGSGSTGAKYMAAFIVLAVVFAAGIIWDATYQLLQQFRWEKDWPIMFSLLTAINEGLAVWWILRTGDVPGHPNLSGTAFAIHFSTVWLLTWLFTIGPMRVPFIRWRFRGGRLI